MSENDRYKLFLVHTSRDVKLDSAGRHQSEDISSSTILRLKARTFAINDSACRTCFSSKHQ